jgi:hypothetical protein
MRKSLVVLRFLVSWEKKAKPRNYFEFERENSESSAAPLQL